MQLSNFITRIIFTTAFISTFLVFSISTIFQYKNFQIDKSHIKEELTNLKKEQIKREVLSVFNLINYKEDLLLNSIKEKIENRVDYAHSIAMSIYLENKEKKTSEDIKLLIARALSNINYGNDKTYFFINSNKGQAILFNKKITLDSYNDIWNLKDLNNNYIIQNQAKIALENKEGFLTNTFVKPDSNDNTQYSKLSYVKLFEPYDLHIGMGEYIDEIREITQKEILDLFADFSNKEAVKNVSTKENYEITGTEDAKRDVKRSGIIVMQYPDGVEFNGGTAQLVIGIAGVGDEHLEILGQITEAVTEDEILEKLIVIIILDRLVLYHTEME